MSDNIISVLLEATMADMPRHIIHIIAPKEPGSYKTRSFIRVMLACEILNECQILSCHLKAGTTIQVNVGGPDSDCMWTYIVTGRETRWPLCG